jgi:hypothetical protein
MESRPSCTLSPPKKFKNKAGIFMIINSFYFWNRPKAGMFMKTKMVMRKSWNVYDK